MKKINSKKFKNKYKKSIIAIFSIFMVCLILLMSGYLYVRGKIYIKAESKEVTDIQNPVKPKEETIEYKEINGITNVLLIGADGIDFNAEDQRSDSMIIATLDSNNKKVKLTSLYRDSIVYIPGY